MAKNTGKKRKRKNVRLHRTVRKTIAAIFMIMAGGLGGLPDSSRTAGNHAGEDDDRCQKPGHKECV